MSGSQHSTVPASKDDVIKFMKEAISKHIYDYIKKEIKSKISNKKTRVLIFDIKRYEKVKQELLSAHVKEKLAYKKQLTTEQVSNSLSVEQQEKLEEINQSLKKYRKAAAERTSQQNDEVKKLITSKKVILKQATDKLVDDEYESKRQAIKETSDALKKELLTSATEKFKFNLEELCKNKKLSENMNTVINLFITYALRKIATTDIDGKKEKSIVEILRNAEKSFRDMRKMFHTLNKAEVGFLGGTPILNNEDVTELFNKIKDDLFENFKKYQDILSSVDDSTIDASRVDIDFMMMMDVEGLVNSDHGEEGERTISSPGSSARSTPRSSAISSARSTPRSSTRELHQSATKSDPKIKKGSKQPKLPVNHVEIESKRQEIASQFDTLKTKLSQLSDIHVSRSASSTKKIQPNIDDVSGIVSDLYDDVEAIFINFQDNQDLLDPVNLDHIADALEVAVSILPDDLNLDELPAEFIGNIKDILDEIASEIDDLQAVEMGSDIDESNSVMAPTDVLSTEQSSYDLFELLREIVEQKIIDDIPKEAEQFIERQIDRLRDEHFIILQNEFQKRFANNDLNGLAELAQGLVNKLSFSTYLGIPNFGLGDELQSIFAPLLYIKEGRAGIAMLTNVTRGSSPRDVMKIVLDDIINFFQKLDESQKLDFNAENTYKAFLALITDLKKSRDNLNGLQKVDINLLINNTSANLDILNKFVKSNVNIAQALSILKLLATDDISGIEKLVSLLSESEYKRIMSQFVIKELYKKNSIATEMPSLLLNYAIPMLDEFKRQAIREQNDSLDELKKQALQLLIGHIDDAIVARQQISVLVENISEIVNHSNELALHATTETNLDNISKILVQLSNDIPHKLQQLPL